MITAPADCIEETHNYIQNLKYHTAEKVLEPISWLSDIIFAPFYQIIIDSYLQYSTIDFNVFFFLKNKETMLRQLLYDSIQIIPRRVLIYDMHRCKNNSRLVGENSSEEYQYYCQNMLSNVDYVYKLCNEYFEMTRLLIVRMTYTMKFLEEMLHNIESGRLEIAKHICAGEEFHYITSLKITGADSHQKGKKAVECTFDTGKKIIYKPHSMQKEIAYHALFTHFCEHTGNMTVSYPVIDCKTYGIAGYMSDFSCENRQQVQEYFRGMGIHLFLCYLLHAGDIHRENIVASIMPVLVDTETIPGIQKRFSVKNAEDQINDKLSWNVLHTGILPFPVWRDNRKGVIISALHMTGDVYSPMKLPIVRNEKASDMYVDYDYIKISGRNSVPTYQGEQIGAEKYIREVSEGFAMAYRFYILNKAQIEERIEPFWKFETRYLVRHTQQYAMYLSSALHPIFMRTTEEHILMLQVIQKKKYGLSVLEKELSSLLNMDTPLLSCKADEYVERYKNSAYETHRHLIERFGLDDMNEQLELIELSLKMMDLDRLQNKYFSSKVNISNWESSLNRKKLEQAIQIIISLVTKKVIIYKEDISWNGLKLEGENLWSVQSVGMGLYDGICGIAVFTSFMHKLGYLQKTNIYTLTVGKVCEYISTEAFQVERCTGLYRGAGALIYTYLILYHFQEDEKYLACAKEAVKRISKIYSSDQEYDLFSGNAGAIFALVKLYELTHDSEILKLAVEIGDWLVKKVLNLECGKCSIVLGGMAHGFSGFIMAYSQIMKHIHDQKYCKVID
ncbi:MAG: type 2 lantipeptide synthetase LanM, partial [Lachnospiraceae bacterium]|nr:type 2 lantipeptide synthetase LanM [Lachnospiraceae bacterium]